MKMPPIVGYGYFLESPLNSLSHIQGKKASNILAKLNQLFLQAYIYPFIISLNTGQIIC